MDASAGKTQKRDAPLNLPQKLPSMQRLIIKEVQG